MADAANLLSILRGTAPAPAPPRPPSATSLYNTAPSSSNVSIHSTNGHASSQLPASAAQAQHELERLFQSAFSTPHPNSFATTVLRPDAPASAPQQHQQSMHAATAAEAGAASPAANRSDSNALLSLLQGVGSPAEAPMPTSQPTDLLTLPQAPQSPPGANAQALLAQLMGGASSPLSPPPPVRLGQMGAGGNTSPARLVHATTSGVGQDHVREQAEGSTREIALAATEQAPPTSPPTESAPGPPAAVLGSTSSPAKSPASAPNFSFASPFDFLAQTHARDQATKRPHAREPVSPTSQSQQTRLSRSPLPPHLRTGTDDARPASATSITSDESEERQGPPPQLVHSVLRHPPLVSSSSATLPSSPSTAALPSSPSTAALPSSPSTATGPTTTSSTFPVSYLTHSHLPPPSSTPFAPSWAPQGLRIPRSALAPSSPQLLSIRLSDVHFDSLAVMAPVITPITLFNVPAAYSSGGAKTAGIWEGGIAYATKGGKIRVIDRESGARLLLKPLGKDKSELVCLEVAGKGKEERRSIATASRDGRMTVWEVSEQFADGETASYRPLLSLSSQPSPAASNPRFPLVRFHPRYPETSVLGIVFNDGRVCMLDVADAARRGAEGGEERLYECGQAAMCGEAIVDFAFSPDGSAFAVLTSDANYSIRSTAAPSETLLSGALPSSSSSPSSIAFLADAARPLPTALAISSVQGTHVALIPLSGAGSGLAAATFELTLPANPDPSPALAELNFSHLAYHRQTNTLLISSSLRGSLFAFRLAFNHAGLPVEAPTDDAAFLAALGSRPAPRTDSPSSVDEDVLPLALRIDHVLETPTPSPVLNFALDSIPHSSPSSQAQLETGPFGGCMPAAVQKVPFGALVLHPGGIHHVALSAEKPRSYAASRRRSTFAVTAAGAPGSPDFDGRTTETEQDEFEAAMAAGRRMSLEGSIYVSSEVEVVVEELDDVDREAQRRASQAQFDVEEAETPTEAVGHDWEAEGDGPSVDEPAAGDIANALPMAEGRKDIKLVGPVVDAANRSMKASEAPSKSSTPVSMVMPSSVSTSLPAPFEVSPSSSHAPPQLASPHSPVIASAPLEPSPSTSSHGRVDKNMDVLRELRRIESAVPNRIEKVVARELEKHAHHLEEERVLDQTAATAREETMLRLVSQSLTKSTSRLVESAIKEQVQAQIVPAIGKVVTGAVQEEVAKNVKEAVKQVLPNEVEKLLLRPDLALHFTRNFSAAIAPSLERSISQAVVNDLVPSFNQNLSTAVESIMQSIWQERVDVRKEIMHGQSAAVAVLEEQMGSLTAEVASLKAILGKMEGLVLALAAPTGPKAMAISPSTHQPALAPQSHSLRQSQSGYSLPPIPRTETPPERYEDLFTNAMQPSEEPDFKALAHLLNSSPPARVENVFPPAPAQPKISMAVVLSLAYRTSQLLKAKEAPLDEEGRRQLLWLKKAIVACDGKQPPEFLAMIPRILDTVLSNLVQRGRLCMALGDAAGAAEIRVVEQYARARAELFPDGESSEGFRR
ncbi:hypothetical protein JCM21900_006012 [Sporobolomyces salmonicolor]